MKNLTEVVAFIQDCRDSHLDPEDCETCGDKAFHEQCVREYDDALRVLRRLYQVTR